MQARVLPLTRGIFWLVAGVQIYRRNPPLLSMLTFANMLLVLVCSQLQPIGPFLLLLISPLVVALIANACAATAEHGVLQISPPMLLRGFRERAPLLLRLGVLQMFYVLLVVVVFDQILPEVDANLLLGARDAAGAAGATGEAADAARAAVRLDPAQLALLFMHLGAIAAVVLPAFWFAPLLTAWHGVPPLKSIFFSFVAVVRNWRAFLAYVAAAAMLGVLLPTLLLSLVVLISGTAGGVFATVLQLLLLLVFAPVLMTGSYCGYRDIFATSTAAVDEVTDAEDGGDDPAAND